MQHSRARSLAFTKRAQSMLTIHLETGKPTKLTDGLSVLRWPNADVMFDGAWKPDWRRRAKCLARMAMTVDARARVLSQCAASEFAYSLLKNHPRAFYPLMSHLLDRRLGVGERLEATLASMQVIPSLLGDRSLDALKKSGIVLIELDDGSRLSLSLSGVSFHEGLWQVGLHSAAGERLYSVGFGLTSQSSLLVANVQGPSLGIDGLEYNRQSTHMAHGMRPPYLLLHALKAIARSWQLQEFVGIDPAHHVKGRWNLRHSRLKFDYRAFWTDHGGVVEADGNWALPILTPRRTLDDVPAKRRAMYRRRYELLDRLEESIRELRR